MSNGGAEVRGIAAQDKVTAAAPPDEPADGQLQTEPDQELYEVLTRTPAGAGTVHRVRADDRAAAEAAVADALDPVADAGVRVVGAAVAGAGLGSGG